MGEFTVAGGEHVINSHMSKCLFLIFDAMRRAGPAVIGSG